MKQFYKLRFWNISKTQLLVVTSTGFFWRRIIIILKMGPPRLASRKVEASVTNSVPCTLKKNYRKRCIAESLLGLFKSIHIHWLLYAAVRRKGGIFLAKESIQLNYIASKLTRAVLSSMISMWCWSSELWNGLSTD